MKSETDINKLKAQIESREKIEAAKIQGQNDRNTQNNKVKVGLEEQKARERAAKAQAAKKPAAAAAKYNAKKSAWIKLAKNYRPVYGASGKIVDRTQVLNGTFGGSLVRATDPTTGAQGWEMKPGSTTTVSEFYNKGVLDGLRPSDMVMLLRTSGVDLSATDMLGLLRRTLPLKNAQAVVDQILGGKIRWS